MVRDVILLPMRVGLYAARVGIETTEVAADIALRVVQRMIPGVPRHHGHGTPDNGDFPSDELRVDVLVAEPPSQDEDELIDELEAEIEAELASEAALAPEEAPEVEAEEAPEVEAEEAPEVEAEEAPEAETPTVADSPPEIESQRETGTAPVAEFTPTHVSEQTQFVEAFAEPGAEEGAGASVHIEEPWNGYAKMTSDDVVVRLGTATREEAAAVELYESMHRRRKKVLKAADRRLRGAASNSSGYND